jgi:hypothetical protein
MTMTATSEYSSRFRVNDVSTPSALFELDKISANTLLERYIDALLTVHMLSDFRPEAELAQGWNEREGRHVTTEESALLKTVLLSSVRRQPR